MTQKTIINKLRRYLEMVNAEKSGKSWYVNPNGHPKPVLPNQEYLEGDYLSHTIESNPQIESEITSLVNRVGKER